MTDYIVLTMLIYLLVLRGCISKETREEFMYMWILSNNISGVTTLYSVTTAYFVTEMIASCINRIWILTSSLPPHKKKTSQKVIFTDWVICIYPF